MADWRPFWISLVRNLSLVIIVCDFSFCYIFMVQLFCIFFSHLNITKLLKFKMVAKRPFLARLLILIKKGRLLQLKFGVVGVGVNIYLWAR